jgi:hypothetical protein
MTTLMIRVSRPALITCRSFAFAALITLGLYVLMGAVSPLIWPPEGYELAFRAAYSFVPWLIPATVFAGVALRRRWRRVGLGMLAGNFIVVLSAMYYFSSPFVSGFRGPPDGLTSLNIALPPPWTNSYDFIGLTYFTADELNRINNRANNGTRLTYVSADVPSASPTVVSVHPIDDYTWGAAALSLRGDCLLILNIHNRENPRYGNTFYAWYPRGSPCVGSVATPETVRQTIWEMHESRTGQRP